MKTITLRVDDSTYRLFHEFASSEHRPMSNMIETAARRHMEECVFVDEMEMEAIRKDKALVRRLRRGAAEVRQGLGRLVR